VVAQLTSHKVVEFETLFMDQLRNHYKY